MPIDTWFPLGIYYSDLENSAQYQSAFVQRIKGLRQMSGSSRVKADSSWTGDIHRVDMIHADPVFGWLTQQVGYHALQFLDALGHDLSMVDLYFQRSWPVIGLKGQSVNRHAHHTAHLSAVYYVSVPSEGDSGKIRFFNECKPNELHEGINTSMTGGYKSYNVLNYQSALYPPVEGRLFLFPSTLYHQVEENNTDQERISISYDLVLTASESELQKSPEFLMPAPSKWRKYGTESAREGLQDTLLSVPSMNEIPSPVRPRELLTREI